MHQPHCGTIKKDQRFCEPFWPVTQWGWCTTGQPWARKKIQLQVNYRRQTFSTFPGTPKMRTDLRPLPTRGERADCSLLMPYLQIPGMLLISWTASSSSLQREETTKINQRLKKIVSKVWYCYCNTNSNSMWCGIWSACCCDYVCICVHLCTHN